MKTLIIDNGTKYLGKLRDLVRELDEDITIKKWWTVDSNFAKDFDLIVLSGGHQFSVVRNPELFKNEIELVKTLTKPILGICLGFEVIAYAYGATLTHSPKYEKGIFKIEKVTDSPIFTKVNDFEVFENHGIRVKNLKDNEFLVPLAESMYGIEIIKHKNKPIYGFQFHPEMFVNKLTGDDIFKNVFNILIH